MRAAAQSSVAAGLVDVGRMVARKGDAKVLELTSALGFALFLAAAFSPGR